MAAMSNQFQIMDWKETGLLLLPFGTMVWMRGHRQAL